MRQRGMRGWCAVHRYKCGGARSQVPEKRDLVPKRLPGGKACSASPNWDGPSLRGQEWVTTEYVQRFCHLKDGPSACSLPEGSRGR